MQGVMYVISYMSEKYVCGGTCRGASLSKLLDTHTTILLN